MLKWLTFLLLLPLPVLASSGGYPFANCGGCHSGGAGTTVPTVTFEQEVYVGLPTTVSVTVANAVQSHAGFSLRLTGGEFPTAPGAGVRRFNATDVSHSTPATLPRTWTMTWTPTAAGNANYSIWGNAVNRNGSSSGDTVNPVLVTGSKTVSLRPEGFACNSMCQQLVCRQHLLRFCM